MRGKGGRPGMPGPYKRLGTLWGPGMPRPTEKIRCRSGAHSARCSPKRIKRR